MTVLSSLAGRHTTLSAREVDHLHRLLGEWQLLSDLAFADLLLLAPVVDRSAFVVLGQVRPYPAQTLYPEDMVGAVLDSRDRPKAAQSLGEKRIVSEGDPEWRDGTPIREVTIPVMLEGEPVAVITAEQNLASARTPSHLELSYLRAAAAIEQMVAEGTFPFIHEEEGERELSPRVGDGFLEMDADLRVTYASPNAVSAYRRLGMTTNITDERLPDVAIDHSRIVDGLDNDTPVEDEIEMGGAWVLRRFIPILLGGERIGAIGFVRDITESRLRDRMLLVKDATIRELQQRAKHNFQTAASLLRLQARRLGTNEARAELEESVRRISSIALVHETLSRESTEHVEFDRVAQRVLEMVESSLVHPDRPVRFSLEGSAGELSSEVATPLSLILTELIQNAVEHAFVDRGGTVTVELKREDPRLLVFVRDNGAGLPPGFTARWGWNLGLQIWARLLSGLAGELGWSRTGGRP